MGFCLQVCMQAWCPLRLEEAIRSLRTGAIVGYKLLCGCWESKLGPLEDHTGVLNSWVISLAPRVFLR